MGNIDDQHRNTNMNNKDHLVGQLTTQRGATAVEASKDMKYLADNFQDNCQGCWSFSNWKGRIFQVVRAQFFSAN